jgi:hypothetical protein
MPQSKKAIKISDLISWLFSNQEIPEEFINQKNKLNSLVPYITEQLWRSPQLINYLNKHINDLYKIPNPIELLKFLKKIIKINKLTRYDLYVKYPTRTPDYISKIMEQDDCDEGNATSKLRMMHLKGIDVNSSEYNKIAPTKTNIKKIQNEDNKKIIEEIMLTENQKELSDLNPKNRYLNEITQEIIDEQELILFDISLLKKTNRILYTFIDKENKKYYKTEDFCAEIYISKTKGVVNNDYIERLDEDKFDKYIFTDIKTYTRLKYMIGDSYKRTVNGGYQ